MTQFAQQREVNKRKRRKRSVYVHVHVYIKRIGKFLKTKETKGGQGW